MSSDQNHDSSPSGLLKNRLEKLKERIRQAALRSERSEKDIRVVAATKTVSAQHVNVVLQLGVNLIGENRVQEAAAKKPLLKMPCEFHLIGPLQSNKARKAVELFDVIESVDRPKLAEMLDRYAFDLGKKQRCLVEIKISPEATKSGVPLIEAASFLASFSKYQNLALEGLMTVGELGLPVEQTRQSFRRMNQFFLENRACFDVVPMLSMGMTEDFEVAIEEGANLVRIGRALFGEREQVA